MTHIVRATSKRYLPFHTCSLHLPRKDSAGVRTDLNLAKQYGSGGVEGVACGTGAVLLYLTRHGIDADGTDISPAKRFVTRVKAEAMGLHLNICPADMTMFSSLRQYSLANIARSGFMHLSAQKKQEQALRNPANQLYPGSILPLNTFDP